MTYFKKMAMTASAFVCAFTLATTSNAKADEKETMQNDSIYDVLVDRFFDKNPQNNGDANSKDPNDFAGGDFEGISTKVQYFKEMDFTFLSLGPLMEAEDFRGKKVLQYNKIQQRFGTKKEYDKMYEELHKQDISVMADFPINGVSNQNTLIDAQSRNAWVSDAEEQGTVDWKTNNPEVQEALIDAAIQYATEYKLDGIRITNIQDANIAFINDMIFDLKKAIPTIKVISDETSKASFDIIQDQTLMDALQQGLKKNDEKSDQITASISPKMQSTPRSIMLDSLNSTRFTYYAAEENMFPPTRVKVALGAVFTLPGTPIMTYGTEITMNGKQSPESLQAMDFRTKDDIIKYIGQLQSLRNGSEALRNGDFKLIKNKDGFIVFERFNKNERWFVVINNTMKTKSIDLPESIVGKNKEIFGMFEKDIVRENDESKYRLVVDREIVEVYQVKDKKGVNIAYLAALGLVYVLFIAFIVAVLRRGKKKRQQLEQKK